jgi:hypothetical protein
VHLSKGGEEGASVSITASRSSVNEEIKNYFTPIKLFLDVLDPLITPDSIASKGIVLLSKLSLQTGRLDICKVLRSVIYADRNTSLREVVGSFDVAALSLAGRHAEALQGYTLLNLASRPAVGDRDPFYQFLSRWTHTVMLYSAAATKNLPLLRTAIQQILADPACPSFSGEDLNLALYAMFSTLLDHDQGGPVGSAVGTSSSTSISSSPARPPVSVISKVLADIDRPEIARALGDVCQLLEHMQRRNCSLCVVNAAGRLDGQADSFASLLSMRDLAALAAGLNSYPGSRRGGGQSGPVPEREAEGDPAERDPAPNESGESREGDLPLLSDLLSSAGSAGTGRTPGGGFAGQCYELLTADTGRAGRLSSLLDRLFS